MTFNNFINDTIATGFRTQIIELRVKNEQLESENARLRSMLEWRPIAEAPRDEEGEGTGGLVILATDKFGHFVCVFWNTLYEVWVNTINGYRVDDLTHFCLLPPPPEV